jgi:hypothetical protein
MFNQHLLQLRNSGECKLAFHRFGSGARPGHDLTRVWKADGVLWYALQQSCVERTSQAKS